MTKNECPPHNPVHTGSGEIVCRKCGEPCAFLVEKDDERMEGRKEEKG